MSKLAALGLCYFAVMGLIFWRLRRMPDRDCNCAVCRGEAYLVPMECIGGPHDGELAVVLVRRYAPFIEGQPLEFEGMQYRLSRPNPNGPCQLIETSLYEART